MTLKDKERKIKELLKDYGKLDNGDIAYVLGFIAGARERVERSESNG